MGDLPDYPAGAVVPGQITHLSPSSIGTWLKCPRQWWYIYVKGLRIPPGASLVTGRAMHHAAELGMRYKRETEEDPTEEAAQDWARDEATQILDNEEHEVKLTERAPTIDSSVRYARTWAGIYAPKAKPLSVETEFAAIIGGVRVVGRIDMTEVDGTVVDWKTSGRAPKVADVVISPQSMIYPRATGATKMEYRYMIGLKTRVNTEKVALTEDEVKLASSLADEQVFDVAESIRGGAFPRRTEGWHCSPKYCGFYKRCMAGKDRP